jgi:hypothetical protein
MRLEGRLFYKTLDNNHQRMFLWEDGIAEISLGNGNYLVLRVLSQREELVAKVKEHFSSQWKTPEKLGHIHCIVQEYGHLALRSLGNAGVKFIPENYNPNVVEDYKEAIFDLKSNYPSGRIVLMHGIMGSGKTHLTRAMLLEVPDAMFVLVSPDIMTDLSGPQLLPILINQRSNAKGPIVLVLEDADKCLVKRHESNMSSIQALLNLGDGIMGSMLDLRIVATTNAEELEIEEALKRPGRMSKQIKVGHLQPDVARKIFDRLCPNARAYLGASFTTNSVVGGKPQFFEKMTLAEVYSLARKYGWKPEVREIIPIPEGPSSHDVDEYM